MSPACAIIAPTPVTAFIACVRTTGYPANDVILPHATSPGLKGWIDANPAEAQAFFATIPMRQVGDCETDIGRFVAMLCSPACHYVNGQSIALDGGQVYLG